MLRHFRGVIVRVLGFEQADGEGEGDADQEGGGEFDAVVVVELDLGQDVGQRDAQEHAGRKPERTADCNVLACAQFARAEVEQQRAGRDRSARTADSRRRTLDDSRCSTAITDVIDSESSGLWNRTAKNVPAPSKPHVAP